VEEEVALDVLIYAINCMSFEQQQNESVNPFAEAETSPWRVVGVYKDAETGEEEQVHVWYAADELSARQLKNHLDETDPGKGWRTEENPDYTGTTPEAA
jgi:hypothetical protein